MREIRTEVTVEAPPAVVWGVLTDLSAYAEWNPQIVDARGTLRPGERVDLRVRDARGRARAIRATVTAVDEERKLSWVGRAPVPWVFEGRHTFELEPTGEGTRVVNREEVKGLVTPLVVTDAAVEGYEAMNEALKARAESMAETGATVEE